MASKRAVATRCVGWTAAGIAVSGCLGSPPPAAPSPVRAPPIEVEVESLELPVVAYLAPPSGDERVDEILASSVMRDPDFAAEVADWVDYWQNAASRSFPDFMRRMAAFEQTVDSSLAERSLPPSLRYLPLIESGYNPSARSRASAVGMWQFMAGTAGELGLEVSAFVDERRSPVKATAAAVDFLERLYDDFGSWFVALAAYNGGPNRARRILREHAPLAQPSDSLFWALRHHWPRETRAFLPKLVGAIIVAQSPGSYGYEVVADGDPFRFDEVTVPDATTLDVLAAAAGVEEDTIRWLNPELFRGFTPPGKAYLARVPAGRAAIFEENYAKVPANRRMTVVEHAVAEGETLSHIAVRYGVSVADLEAANPGVRPRFLRVGATLTVPIALAKGGAG